MSSNGVAPELREAVLERDGHACVTCARTLNLVVHHRSYSRPGGAGVGLADLVTLCAVCNTGLAIGAKLLTTPEGRRALVGFENGASRP